MTDDKKTVKKGDFLELVYTGYSNGEIFDSNIPGDLEKIAPKAKVKQTIVAIGESMVVPGLDKALEGKEIGKEYDVKMGFKEGFGERRKELVRIVPLKAFTEKDVTPRPGVVLALDDQIVKVLAISGARVTVDFNNPLAGRDLEYRFTIVRKVDNTEEKAKALFETLLRFVPEFEVKDKIIMKGPKVLETLTKSEEFNKKFKELVGKELDFEEKKEEGKSEKGNEVSSQQSL